MGFFSGLLEGLGLSGGQQRNYSSEDSDAREILNIYKDDDEDALIAQAEGRKVDYRARAFENTQSVSEKYQCVRCKRWFAPGDIDIDHIVPQSKGGDSTRYNLQCMCKHCNRSKRDDTSDTQRDLRRRKRELDRQDKEDIAFINSLNKNNRKKVK